MNEEDVDAVTLEAARARVWGKVTNTGSATCAEFRPDFPAYLGKALGDSRRILVEDHLSRCSGCRARIAEMKGREDGRRDATAVLLPVDAMGSAGRGSRTAAGGRLSRAGRHRRHDGSRRPAGHGRFRRRAACTAWRVGSLEAGAAIGEHESVRTGPGAHAVLRLADGSMVDVNERTELFVSAAWSGQAIHLQRGDIIVKAAKQRRGHLRVLTRDSIASVKGTVFAVSAGMGGSVVSVVEGSVAVNQPGKEVLLSPGQQAASIPALASSVSERRLLEPRGGFLPGAAHVAREDRTRAGECPRRTPDQLDPALVSSRKRRRLRRDPESRPHDRPGALPRRGAVGPERDVRGLVEFRDWTAVETDDRSRPDREPAARGRNRLLRQPSRTPRDRRPVPIVMAGVRPGRRAELSSALEGLFAAAGESPAAYSVTDDLMVVSSSPSNLAWALAHQGQGAGSPFAAALGDRYRRGVGWLIGMDAPPVVKMAAGDDAPPIELAGMIGMKYVFLEQRAPAGAVENEVTLAFQGARTGMGSWLADAGSGGAAEYLPADALLAGYVSTREPLQLFEEFAAQITRSEPDFEQGLTTLDEKLGAGFVQNLAGALGTEAALALTGLSTSGPTWVMASVANNPAVIDSSLQKLVETFNAELGPDEQGKRIVLQQESTGGRTWSTMKPGGLPVGIVWTYDRGYLVAASDRGVAERAIATRNGGSPLVWSPEFLGQLPSSAGLHPSAFAWLNAKGALGILSTLTSNPKLGELVAGSDPILVVFDGTPEQIHAASRYSYLRADHGRDADREPGPSAIRYSSVTDPAANERSE